jgi:signal transduction histidine kinase
MRRLAGLVRRVGTTGLGDALLAVVIVAWTIPFLVADDLRGHQHWLATAFIVPFCAALAIRRRWPLAGAALASAALVAAVPLGQVAFLNGLVALPFLATPFLLAYSLGTGAGLPAGLAGTAVLAASLLFNNGGFNPILLMMTFGPWIVGRVVRSRRKLTKQLAARNAELAAEQENFARESVRYERARIARELHDIVAHCVSIMVVQASAGQRVRGTEGMTLALACVADAAGQAKAEIGRLVELLSGDLPPGRAPSVRMVDDLVRRAAATGLDVTCRITGPCDELPAAASEVAYRVVQEGLTNALKHAPGAPVQITLTGVARQVEIAVENPAAGSPAASAEERSAGSGGLAGLGGGYGLAGMLDRVRSCGGTLTAGPTLAGGWRVAVLLPVGSA